MMAATIHSQIGCARPRISRQAYPVSPPRPPFVRAAPGAALDKAELDAHVREELAAYKAPRIWVFVEELPMTPSGKVQKFVCCATASWPANCAPPRTPAERQTVITEEVACAAGSLAEWGSAGPGERLWLGRPPPALRFLRSRRPRGEPRCRWRFTPRGTGA
jgi:hypothetical protein